MRMAQGQRLVNRIGQPQRPQFLDPNLVDFAKKSGNFAGKSGILTDILKDI
jgi:hypothetical protein